jgi:hypothetical protein
MAKNLMICANTNKALQLNESEVAPGKKRYILEGVFAELDTLNRNQRIYKKDEYLKHLQYLRNDIKNGEPLLGELDHPEGRFEVKLKEASHRILDLWYDASKNVVMGKIELLNTPNGLLAQSIVDQGIPLHISSRAVGSVNKDNTVDIQQIYTYDLVCKPGFASAVLHRVNESADTNQYSTDVKSFLANSIKTESQNSALQYGIVNENVSVSEMTTNAVLRKEAKDLQINKQIEINENDMITPLTKGNRALKNNILLEDDNIEDKDKNADTTDKREEDSSEVKGVEIIDVTPEFEDDKNGDSVEIKDVEADHDDSDKTKEDDSNDEQNEGEDSSYKCGDTIALNDAKKTAKTKNDIDKQKEEFNSKFDKLIAAIEKKNKQKDEAKCESVILARYPVTMMMNESNFAKFAALNESDKIRVIAYLQSINAVTSKAINENWEQGLNYVEDEPVWLKYASKDYRTLYENASPKIKENLASSAKYFIFENQSDVDIFWENSGLAEAQSARLLNESFINNMPKIAATPVETNLPYSVDFIKQIADMACEYNR